ncbi:anaerobic ribonucleoside-triphosphate reductase activating protein [Gleimia sp. 6138-11-ORH1]|uniref:anaerobic ribonucleoside-triphosphate reductase activating protein n=1 Tax=Gleimia sp. 6138-11-ORH1 TaxID=2973937 RepID=UPI0021684AA8|nr:anaerobic ribonucleoside-triphosphate reductase activating protein [Gleimia sp. 6138-11-ORH1]MCS4484728.1 anaerobic ribonucleoside-triphosphate reductase activating protein [Gleimia sp. 6138-11-ORH1]
MLQIAGIQPLSTVDWPGKLVLTVFCQGCPWACVYCQNHQILDPRTPGQVPWADVLDLLKKRVGLLDGVVFSGGEACRQAAPLLSAMQQVKDMGFAVGLHTAGAFPRVLETALNSNLVDWVGLDIKAPASSYPQVVGKAGGNRAWESLEILLEGAQRNLSSLFDYEVRLTVFPQMPFDPAEVVRTCAKMQVRTLVIQKAHSQGALPKFANTFTSWDAQYEKIKENLSQITDVKLLFR